MDQIAASRLQEAIETVESLSPDDQNLLIELIRHRLVQEPRAEMATEVAEARADYQRGQARRGTVADLMQELAP